MLSKLVEVRDTLGWFLWTYVALIPWKIAYSLTEIYLFRFPEILGGYENKDKYFVCARIFNISQREITEAVYQTTCLNKFDEVITGKVYVFFAMAIGLLLREVWATLWEILKERLKQVKKPAGASRDNEKANNTKKIRDACLAFTKEVCNIHQLDVGAVAKLNAITRAIRTMNGLVQREIPYSLIGVDFVKRSPAVMVEAVAINEDDDDKMD